MNFNAHVLVAQLVETTPKRQGSSSDETSGPDAGPLVGLGAALPDLASIAGCRLVNDPVDDSLRRGVELHHATDRAFHDHSWFIAGQGNLHDRLRGEGLERGPARACAHVGIELLIDGYLLGSRDDLAPAVEAGFRTIPSVIGSLTDLTASDKQARWQTFLARSAEWPTPNAEDYAPSAVADRLHRILEPRRRLRFDRAEVGVVTQALDDMVAEVELVVEALLVDVVSEIASEVVAEVATPVGAEPGDQASARA